MRIKVALKFFIVFVLSTACSNYQKTNSNAFKKVLPDSKSSQTQIKLVGTWYQQGERETLLKDFVRWYNFTHQETEVVITFSEDIPGYVTDLEKSIQHQIHLSQSEWDILLLNNNFMYTMDGESDWAKKYFVDFSQIREFNENTLPGLINDSIKNLWSGIVPGPFVEGFSYSMWCNKNVANKIGVDVKQIGMTFDDLLSYIKALYEYNQKNPNDYIIPIYEGGSDWKTLSKFFEQLYASALNDNEEYFKDYTSEKKLNGWYKTLKGLQELSIYEPLSPEWRSMPWNGIFDLLMEDKCLFYSNGSWLYNQLQSVNRADNLKNIMPTEYPVFNPVRNYPAGYSILWGVPKNAPHKDEAIKFLLALNSATFSEEWVRKTKCPTGIQGSLATVSLGLDQFENFVFNINAKYGKNNFVANGNQMIFGSLERANNNFAYEVMTGELTAEEAMVEIRKTLDNHGVQVIQN